MTIQANEGWAFERLIKQMQTDGITSLPALEELARLFQLIHVPKGGMFLEQGTMESRIAFVAKGCFRYFYITPDGDDITKHFAIENDFVCSYASMLYQRPSAYGIVAEEPSVLLVIGREQYLDMINQQRSWERMARHYTEHIYNLKELREASLLLQDATTRYLSFVHDFPQYEKRFKQRHIATYLGIHPVSLSRLKNKL